MGTRKTEKHNRTTIFSPLFERKWGVLGTFCIVLLLLFLAIYLVNPEPILKKIDALAGVSASPAPAPDALEVYVLDVGQGDCILLRTPGGKAMLVDAGEAIYAARIKRFLDGFGITRLDAVVATHPHTDHIGSMAELISAYEIGTFYLPDTPHTTESYLNMLEALERAHVRTKTVYAPGTLNLGDKDVSIRILSPFEGVDYNAEGMNNWSIVLRVQYGETSILLTGDAEAYAEGVMRANLRTFVQRCSSSGITADPPPQRKRSSRLFRLKLPSYLPERATIMVTHTAKRLRCSQNTASLFTAQMKAAR